MTDRAKLVLHLPLKAEFFDAIKRGEKMYEYRLYNDYWQKRILGKCFDEIVLTKGYPRRSDIERILRRPYMGWAVERIKHPHFGPISVEVFAIRVN